MHEHPSMREALRERKVILCVGPGGVGKTTSAAAIALAAARGGRRVVVVTIDPSQRLAQALGLTLAPAGAAAQGAIVPVPGAVAGDGALFALVLDTRRVFDEIVRVCSASPERADAVLQNPLYEAMSERLGGALEYAAMARLQMLHASGDYDLVVLDTPPTANAIDFLDAPERVREVMSNPVARLLAGTGRVGVKILGLGATVIMSTLRAMGGAQFISDFGEFLRDFSDVIVEFHRRAGAFDEMLVSRDTGVVLTTAPTAFSVREARGFLATLRKRGLRVDGVVLNRFDPEVPPLPDEAELRLALDGRLATDDASALEAIKIAHAAARSQGEHAALARRELEQSYPELPICVVPRRDPPPMTLDELSEIGGALIGRPGETAG
jgi:anion-transporting  ArsA/GET3 family ATPase